ncbi:hypothetical protein [Moorena producens]|uniref:hypothetical protein n=1 Tax=Moorena producens TaxID=1155739 RepID=UPI003C70BC3C
MNSTFFAHRTSSDRVYLNACCFTRWCVTGRTVPLLTDKIKGSPSLTHPTQLIVYSNPSRNCDNFVPDSRFPIPDSRFPVPCSLFPIPF